MRRKKPSIAVVIPVYNPPSLFWPFVTRLRRALQHPLIVVNDGSSDTFAGRFADLAALPGTTVLIHPRNRGKGAALKTAMVHIRTKLPDVAGIVTVDADGQHEVTDIRACLTKAVRKPDHFLIGTRLPRKQMPMRSRTGNAATRIILRVLHRMFVRDTQSGLRYIPKSLMAACELSTFDKYDFELDMIIRAIQSRIPYAEFPIRPIYINRNRASHFKVVKDSLFVAQVFVYHLRNPKTKARK